MLIEDKASGTQLIQELVELGLHAVTRYQPRQDKIMRMHAQTAMIENGFVHLPKEAGWRAEYLHELAVFPGGKYDDQVDSTAQLLDWLKQAGREPGGIYQYYKELAQAPQTPRPEPLSVMAKLLGSPPVVTRRGRLHARRLTAEGHSPNRDGPGACRAWNGSRTTRHITGGSGRGRRPGAIDHRTVSRTAPEDAWSRGHPQFRSVAGPKSSQSPSWKFAGTFHLSPRCIGSCSVPATGRFP